MKIFFLALTLTLLSLVACTMNSPESIATPTVQAETFTPTDTPTDIPSDTPAPSGSTPINLGVTDAPLVASETTTFTPAPPSATSLPTETPGPYEYQIQVDDTLMYIIQLPQHGYGYDLGVAQQVVELNENMSSIDFLPPVGSTILIPRQTATPIPEGANMTAEALATLRIVTTSGVPLSVGSTVACYAVQEGDSLVSIAENYNTNLEILSGLNPSLYWFGCNFGELSGGSSCNPTIQVGECINVPQPTAVPSNTPTPSGNETLTPTPPYPAPRLLYPVNGITVPAGRFDLQWIEVTGIQSGDEYLVELTDNTTGQKLLQVTRATSFRIPASFVPSDGQTHEIQWRVSVARKNDAGVYGYIGGLGAWRAFEWLSQ